MSSSSIRIAVAVAGLALAGATGSGLTRSASAGIELRPADATAPADAISTAFRNVARSAAPSVVHITMVESLAADAGRDHRPSRDGGNDPGDMLRRFFAPGGPLPPGAAPFGAPPPARRGQGTGFIVDADGTIVTNNHVVSGAERLRVRLQDGRAYDAEIVGADAETDLAVIRIDADELRPLPLGDSDAMEVGDWVVAIGSPFGLDQSVTSGIVSATGRSGVGLATFESYIQTDAAINPGNSGGPLLNLRGEVIGVNTAISSRGGGNDGIGFAIPSRMVHRVVNSLLDEGRVRRGWLGVSIQPLDETLARTFGRDTTDGVLVADVLAGSPAAEAGLEIGDIVVGVGARHARGPADLLNAVAAAAPGSVLDLEIVRDGTRIERAVALGTRPGPDGLASATTRAAPRWGLRLASRTDGDAGALVVEILPASPAAAAGLRAGDVIVAVDGVAIADAAAGRVALAGGNVDRGLRLLVQRGKQRRFVVLGG